MDERILIEKCLEGNRQAQQQLYKQFASKMMAVCYRYAHSLEDAEDVLQEGFVKVFTSLKSFRHEGSLEGWIRKIMVHLSINQLKSKRYFETVDMEDASWQQSQADASELMEEIRSLPHGFRTVFNLYAIEGYSHKEIGELLGITESTSRSQYARARAILIKRISANTKQDE